MFLSLWILQRCECHARIAQWFEISIAAARYYKIAAARMPSFEKNTWSDAFQVKLQLALCLQGPMRPLFVLESAMVFVVFFWPHSLMITNMSDCPLWRFDATGWPNQIGWKSAQSGVHCQLPRMSCKPGPCMPFVWLSILAHGLEWQLWCQLNNLYFSDSGTTPQMLTFWGCVRFSRCQSLCLWKKL